MRSTSINIHLTNLVRNYTAIQEYTGGVPVIAGVKADAYGHGMTETVEVLEKLGNKPLMYAVAFAEEGIELRKSFPEIRILLLEGLHSDNILKVLDYGLTPAVFDEEHLRLIKHYNTGDDPLPVHIKVDTGMNRLGIRWERAFDFILRASREASVRMEGIMTHYASADDIDCSMTDLQTARFSALISGLKSAGVDYGTAHAANSAAIWNHKNSYFDAVRPGISLYGYFPFRNPAGFPALHPVMEVTSRVESIKEILKDETSGYGGIYKSEHTGKIASIPIGYADGVNRALSGKITVLVNGKIFRQVGRISMDRIMIETGNEEINFGDTVTLIGRQSENEITAWDWAELLETIPYEITCMLNAKRMRKTFIN